MAEYIEREALIKRIEASPAFPNIGTDGLFLLGCVTDLIAAIPTADVVEVVRCKDCVFWNTDKKGFSDECVCRRFSVLNVCDKYTLPTDFCSYGERR